MVLGRANKFFLKSCRKIFCYTEQVKKQGLNLLCTPGNDVESTTAMAGSGANLIIFTTGLGTPTGNAIAPVIKISSNTSVFKKMSDIIDFNSGSVVEGTQTMESLSTELLDYIIQVASGEIKTKSINGKSSIFKPGGVVLEGPMKLKGEALLVK